MRPGWFRVTKGRTLSIKKIFGNAGKGFKRASILLKQLKINGNVIIEFLGISEGLRVGYILNVLMNEVLDQPEKNEAAV